MKRPILAVIAMCCTAFPAHAADDYAYVCPETYMVDGIDAALEAGHKTAARIIAGDCWTVTKDDVFFIVERRGLHTKIRVRGKVGWIPTEKVNFLPSTPTTPATKPDKRK